MKAQRFQHIFVVLAALICLPTIPAKAQFNYVTNNGDIAITGYTGSGGDVTIPNSTNSYPVTCIGSNAFYGCITVTAVTIPSSVTNIGLKAFAGCPALTNLTVNAANSNYTSAGGVLFDQPMTTLIQYPGGLAGSYSVSNSVLTIGSFAFYYCSRLTNVVIAGSVASIGAQAFAWCSGLTNVTIPNRVTNVDSLAFANCSSLTNVTIGWSMSNVGGDAFHGCTNLHNALFLGNAPSANGGAGNADSTVFSGETGMAYYEPGCGLDERVWRLAHSGVQQPGYGFQLHNQQRGDHDYRLYGIRRQCDHPRHHPRLSSHQHRGLRILLLG